MWAYSYVCRSYSGKFGRDEGGRGGCICPPLILNETRILKEKKHTQTKLKRLRNMNMGIWVVVTLNHLFIRGSWTESKFFFKIKQLVANMICSLWLVHFVLMRVPKRSFAFVFFLQRNRKFYSFTQTVIKTRWPFGFNFKILYFTVKNEWPLEYTFQNFVFRCIPFFDDEKWN